MGNSTYTPDRAYMHGWDCFTRKLDENPYSDASERENWANGFRASSHSKTSKQIREVTP